MTVQELITKLEGYDPNVTVVCAGYEGGYTEDIIMYFVPLKANINTKWYYGEHEPTVNKEDSDFIALAIGR